jgi:hypothetical protein
MNEILTYIKLHIQETLVRLDIHFQLFEKYGNKLKKFSKNKKELDNLIIYKPQIFSRLFFVLLPVYLIQSNLILFFVFRKNITLSKYMGIILFNLFGINYFCLVLEKKLFFEYISKPNPCSKYMREEYIRLT